MAEFRAEVRRDGARWAELGTVVHDGHECTAGGAADLGDRLIGYLGQSDGADVGPLLSWGGETIGRYCVTSTWRTPRSYLSSTMSQVYVTLPDGRTFTGRSAGEGMLFRGRITQEAQR